VSQENLEIVQELVGCIVIAPDGTRVLTTRCPTRWRSRSRI